MSGEKVQLLTVLGACHPDADAVVVVRGSLGATPGLVFI